jgi:hypothetical protein
MRISLNCIFYYFFSPLLPTPQLSGFDSRVRVEDGFPSSGNSLHDRCIFDKHVKTSVFATLLFDLNGTVLEQFSYLFLGHEFPFIVESNHHSYEKDSLWCHGGVETTALQCSETCARRKHSVPCYLSVSNRLKILSLTE